MAYSIKEAKELVVRAGHLLVESGLIARTWGNISARISDTQFVISPSGLAYETLTPEQIVVVNIEDCSYEGNIKPSSEKGIHADAYKIRSEVNFIIHTHQEKASVLSIEGNNLNVSNSEDKAILGDVVPCAAYGISSTNKLRKAVAYAVDNYPASNAILMKNHGTMCMGKDLDHSFEIAMTLEKVAEDKYLSVCKMGKELNEIILDYGCSERRGNSFLLTHKGESCEYKIGSLSEHDNAIAILHEEIYKNSNINNIIHTTDKTVVEVSSSGRVLKPFIDDLAQIAGVNIKIMNNDVKAIARQLKSKNAVLLKNAGALCTGITESDAKAVAMVLKKGCAADLYATTLNKSVYLGFIDAYLQRIVYIKKYSKQKE